MSEHIDLEDLALYAMHSLPAAEAEEIKNHLSQCQQCTEELHAAGGDLAMYSFTAPSYEVPEGSKVRFLQAMAAEPRHTAATRPVSVAEPQGKKKVVSIAPWLGWAVAAALALFAVNLYQQTGGLRDRLASEISERTRIAEEATRARLVLDTLTNAHAMRVTLTQPSVKKEPSASATYAPSTGTLLFAATNLAPLKSGKVYELWLLPADNSKPVPAGIFTPDPRGEANLVLPRVEGAVAAKAFGVTVENEGGSETPTMPIVLAGS